MLKIIDLLFFSINAFSVLFEITYSSFKYLNKLVQSTHEPPNFNLLDTSNSNKLNENFLFKFVRTSFLGSLIGTLIGYLLGDLLENGKQIIYFLLLLLIYFFI